MIAVTFRHPTASDLAMLAQTMRGVDVLECHVVGGHMPLEALEEGVAGSLWAYVAEVEGEVVCAFGVASEGLLSEEGAPWMLCAEGIERHARAVLLHAGRYVARMQETFERLHNVVHADNRSAIRFLKWCGFKMGERFEMSGEPFLGFTGERAVGELREAA